MSPALAKSKPSRVPVVTAVQNIKGGVGKTTTAVNLAALLAERHGKKVLLIDADAQCNASLYLLNDEVFGNLLGLDGDGSTLYDVFHREVEYIDLISGKRHGPKRKKTPYPYKIRESANGGSLHLLCGHPRLFEVQEIAPEMVVLRIERWIKKVGHNFDHILIDCPPSISSVSLSALRAASGVVVPMAPDVFALHGLPMLLDNLARYKKALNLRAKVCGVVVTMFPFNDTKEVGALALKYAGGIFDVCQARKVPVLSPFISKSTAYPKSTEQREPLAFSANVDHEHLVKELENLARQLKFIEEVVE